MFNPTCILRYSNNNWMKSEIITSEAETQTSNELPTIILQTIAQTTSLSDEGHTHHYFKFKGEQCLYFYVELDMVFVLLSV